MNKYSIIDRFYWIVIAHQPVTLTTKSKWQRGLQVAMVTVCPSNA